MVYYFTSRFSLYMLLGEYVALKREVIADKAYQNTQAQDSVNLFVYKHLYSHINM